MKRAVGILERRPDLLAEWHAAKNGDLQPETARSGEKVWWCCARDLSHEWHALVSSRMAGSGCPYCAGRRANGTNSLAFIAPELAAEWHPTLNGTLTVHDVTAGSQKQVWWRCKRVSTHEWRTTICLRTQQRGCPYCSGRRVTPETSLAACAPAIAAEWHPSKNGRLGPGEVTRGSGTVAWWKCSRNPEHEWQDRVARRTGRGDGCPFCSGHRVTAESSLAAKAPDLAAQWHPTKNGSLTPWDLAARSEKSVWWKCPAGSDHEWMAVPANRFVKSNCPFCINKRLSVTNSLAATRPDLAAEWHPTRNGNLTPADVFAGSQHRVWWKCPRGPDHEWETSLYGRHGCPFCANKRVSVTNSLATLFPSLAGQWHSQRNAGLTPDQVIAGMTRKMWWICPFGHEWQASPGYRIHETAACPLCPRRKGGQATTRRRRREIVLLPSDWK